MLNFVGTGIELHPGDFIEQADRLDVHVAKIKAVNEVEAASTGFGSKDRPRILFEPHVFYRELGSGPKRDRAVRDGLAYKKWGTKPYPRTADAQYDRLERAIIIDETAALRSASWGLGQVMGFNHELAGYSTVQFMVKAMMTGEGAQLEAMVNFILSAELDDELQRGDWAGFARGYNGAGYAKNNYHTKLSRAYQKFLTGGKAANQFPLLILGSSNKPKVKEVQRRLKLHGNYGGRIDGLFGPKTEQAVKEFQEDHPITGFVDGKVGKNTWTALLEDPGRASNEAMTPPAPESQPEKKDPPIEAVLPVVGGGISEASGTPLWVTLVIIAGLAMIAYAVWSNRKSVTRGFRRLLKLGEGE